MTDLHAVRPNLTYFQAALYGAGTFLAIMIACACVAALSIGGMPTRYETSNLKGASATAIHDIKGAVRRVRNGVCRRLPIAMRDMTPCPKPVARSHEARAQPAVERHAETRHPTRRTHRRRTAH